MGLRALLFDLDGTLADTDPLHLRAWQRCLRESGIPVNEQIYREVITGRTTPQVVRHFFPRYGDADVARFSEAKEQCFRELATGLQAMAGLQELLRGAHRAQKKTAIVTNGSRANVDYMLGVLKLDHEFDVHIYGEELHVGKPDPLPYRLALARLGVAPEEAIAFEDSPTGISSAVAAGLRTIGIASSQPEEMLLKTGADLVVEDFHDDRLSDFVMS
jgi:HAD superfamily hydrolase (TIGR01509 family)